MLPVTGDAFSLAGALWTEMRPCCRRKKSKAIGGTAICRAGGCCRRRRRALPQRLPAHLRQADRARRSEPLQPEAPRLEPGEALPIVSLGGRAGAPSSHPRSGRGGDRAGHPGVSHHGLAEGAAQRELRSLAPGRDVFRTGAVRACHRLGGADAVAAGERLRAAASRASITRASWPMSTITTIR